METALETALFFGGWPGGGPAPLPSKDDRLP